MKKHLVWMIPALAAAIYINHKVDTSAKLSTGPSSVSMENGPAQRPGTTTEAKPEMTAADAQQYGIEMEKSEAAVKTEDDWASQMMKTLNDPAVEESMDGQGIWEGLRENPQRIREKLERVEEDIRQQQVRIRQFPADPYEKSRLQSLYMLKATLTALGEKTAPSPADQYDQQPR